MRSHVDSIRVGPPKILLLGGSPEASQLATLLLDWSNIVTVTSLAGRLAQPILPTGNVRVGGFGGVDGLTSYLLEENVCVVIDATHPFAIKISKNAELACKRLGISLIALERPPWEPGEYDTWTHVADTQSAASLVEDTDDRIFLSIGRQEVSAFASCKHAWFLIRAIDPPDEPLPLKHKIIHGRGPFDLGAELKMLRDESIDVLITKNSGGIATYPKIEAARQLGIKVIIIDRPRKHNIPTVSTLEELLQSLSKAVEMTLTSRSR